MARNASRSLNRGRGRPGNTVRRRRSVISRAADLVDFLEAAALEGLKAMDSEVGDAIAELDKLLPRVGAADPAMAVDMLMRLIEVSVDRA